MAKHRVAKKWILPPPASPQELARLAHHPPLVAQILFNRGLRSPEAVDRFLASDELPRQPEAMTGVSEAVEYILTALERGERIAVFGDYDADGVTATALLMQTLLALGVDAQAHLPHRVHEGYGLNIPALKELVRRGISLLITVDCGIRDHEAVQWAREAGLTVVVTDHHSIGATIPAAHAVVNPKQAGDVTPTKNLAGVGVAFMLAYALLREFRRRNGPANYPDLRLSDLLDLVAIGTIADLMTLNDPVNRAFVNEGLKVIQEGRRTGLRTLMVSADLTPSDIDAGKIAFRLAPRINAAGRLDDARLAYELLLSSDENEAFSLANQLRMLNQRRQLLTNQALETVRQRLADHDHQEAPIICAGDPEFLHGIVGLVAGRLTEEFYRPSVIWEQGEEFSHASCRSIPAFNIIEALDDCDDLLERHGGHNMAAGLTVSNDKLPALVARLQNRARLALRGKNLQPILKLDAQLSAEQVNLSLLDELQKFEPTGYENPQPLFLVPRLRIKKARIVGKDGEHLSLQFENPAGGLLRGIAFHMSSRREMLTPYIDIATTIESNVWNGRRRLDLNIRDFRPVLRE